MTYSFDFELPSIQSGFLTKSECVIHVALHVVTFCTSQKSHLGKIRNKVLFYCQFSWNICHSWLSKLSSRLLSVSIISYISEIGTMFLIDFLQSKQFFCSYLVSELSVTSIEKWGLHIFYARGWAFKLWSPLEPNCDKPCFRHSTYLTLRSFHFYDNHSGNVFGVAYPEERTYRQFATLLEKWQEEVNQKIDHDWRKSFVGNPPWKLPLARTKIKLNY